MQNKCLNNNFVRLFFFFLNKREEEFIHKSLQRRKKVHTFHAFKGELAQEYT